MVSVKNHSDVMQWKYHDFLLLLLLAIGINYLLINYLLINLFWGVT
jgi:hypothetical protein